MEGRPPHRQTGLQEPVCTRPLLAAPLIFICWGFGKSGSVPAARAASNPAASSEEAPRGSVREAEVRSFLDREVVAETLRKQRDRDSRVEGRRRREVQFQVLQNLQHPTSRC